MNIEIDDKKIDRQDTQFEQQETKRGNEALAELAKSEKGEENDRQEINLSENRFSGEASLSGSEALKEAKQQDQERKTEIAEPLSPQVESDNQDGNDNNENPDLSDSRFNGDTRKTVTDEELERYREELENR